ncbi:MAG: crossover junction endodeoxyribonuclease RuvC [bacterium]|nr:crossover junction endodeoxyribonuclease RuvC [bacterium]
MKILAIDPGYERLGIAIIEKEKGGKETLLYSECFKTSAKDAHAKRLGQISKKISETLNVFPSEALAIEELFLNTNQKTAMKVSEARGVVIAEAARAGLPVFEYTPLQIKVAVTGYGRSDKKAVISMIEKLINLSLDKKPQDDEYDAIATGLTFFATQRAYSVRQ